LHAPASRGDPDYTSVHFATAHSLAPAVLALRPLVLQVLRRRRRRRRPLPRRGRRGHRRPSLLIRCASNDNRVDHDTTANFCSRDLTRGDTDGDNDSSSTFTTTTTTGEIYKPAEQDGGDSGISITGHIYMPGRGDAAFGHTSRDTIICSRKDSLELERTQSQHGPARGQRSRRDFACQWCRRSWRQFSCASGCASSFNGEEVKRRCVKCAGTSSNGTTDQLRNA